MPQLFVLVWLLQKLLSWGLLVDAWAMASQQPAQSKPTEPAAVRACTTPSEQRTHFDWLGVWGLLVWEAWLDSLLLWADLQGLLQHSTGFLQGTYEPQE